MITDDTLRTLLDMHDDLGVLTILAGFAPDHAGRPTAPIQVRNLLRDLRSDLDGDTGKALDERLGELGDELGGMLAPGASGRGRALFVGLASGQTQTINIQLPFDERVVLRERAYVRPLIAAIDEGRPTGIVVVWQEGVRVLEWTIGRTRELATMEFELGGAQLEVHRGPGPGNPAMGQTSASHKERLEDRIDSNRHRFFKEAGGAIDAFVKERGWDRVVIAGGDKVRTELAGELAASPTDLLHIDSAWETRSSAQIAQEAWPVVRAHHRERERVLVEDVRERSAAGGAGALGPARVCKAVNQGQVAHLLFSHDADVEGYRAPSMGTLHADVSGNAAQSDIHLEHVPHLVEELVERVLATGGRVTRVDDEEAVASLAAHHGLAARLRW